MMMRGGCCWCPDLCCINLIFTHGALQTSRCPQSSSFRGRRLICSVGEPRRGSQRGACLPSGLLPPLVQLEEGLRDAHEAEKAAGRHSRVARCATPAAARTGHSSEQTPLRHGDSTLYSDTNYPSRSTCTTVQLTALRLRGSQRRVQVHCKGVYDAVTAIRRP